MGGLGGLYWGICSSFLALGIDRCLLWPDFVAVADREIHWAPSRKGPEGPWVIISRLADQSLGTSATVFVPTGTAAPLVTVPVAEALVMLD